MAGADGERFEHRSQAAGVISIWVSRDDMIDVRRIAIVPPYVIDNAVTRILEPGVDDVDPSAPIYLIAHGNGVTALGGFDVEKIDLEVIAHAFSSTGLLPLTRRPL
jgi:hypothetical protein